jgi:hypothetical protein
VMTAGSVVDAAVTTAGSLADAASTAAGVRKTTQKTKMNLQEPEYGFALPV